MEFVGITHENGDKGKTIDIITNMELKKPGLLSFIRSQRGAPLLTRSGFVYRCERHTGERSYWLCIRYKTIRCGGRLICQGNDIVKFTMHNHEQDWTRIDRSVEEYKSLASPEIDAFLNSFKPTTN